MFYLVNETEFKAKLPNNPENLRSCSPSSFCSKAQPRHRLSWPSRVNEIFLDQRYVLYYQCLPGCINTTKYKNMKTMKMSGAAKYIWMKNDTNCWPYRKQSTVKPNLASAVKTSGASVSNLNTTHPSSSKIKETQDSGKHHVLECENIISSFSN